MTDLLDTAALTGWLDARLSGHADIRVESIQGGASNLIFRVERGEEAYCLRRPPLVSNDPTANNMRRELVLLRALSSTSIPHARLIADCEDDSVIGAPFALMQWVDGVAGREPLPDPFAGDPLVRRDMAFALIDALARISNTNWQAIGLEGFGKPEGFLDRQVGRWLSQLERCRSRDLPHLDDLALWLDLERPETQRSGLLHGDFQFANVMFAREQPVRLMAVVDWESATIGDPMLDLGWMLAGWENPGEEPTFADYIRWGDFPPREALAERYAAATGLDVSRLDYYMALALFKLAVIMEGWHFRYRNGQTSHPIHAKMEQDVPRMLARAARFAGVS
jgi:aminoglycoside phosphotransferase (APT) family kinase protein